MSTGRTTQHALLIALLAIPGLAWAQTGGVVPGVVASGPQAPARDGNAPQTGTGRVRGRVLTDTGQPLRRAPTQLSGSTLRPPRLTTTDTDGRYEFADLPSGHFTIAVSRTGYIRTPSDGFDLADGEHRDNVDLKVVRGGVITGQIVDEFGEPAINANVSVMRSQYSQGVRRLVNAGPTATSNDIGEFRLFGLNTGQYYVSVAPRNDTITIATPTQGGANPIVTTSDLPSGYAPTYYPGTPDAASAQRVNVSAGQTTGNVNIVLVPTRLSRVSGTAVDLDGRPITRGNVNILPRNGMGTLGFIPSNGGTLLRPDGSFTVANVPPGEYYLRVPIPPATTPPPLTPGSPPPPQVFAIASVSVFGDDISGVTLVPMKPVTVRGRIMFDDALAQQSLRAENVRVIPQPIDTTSVISGGFQPVPVKDDFSFEVPVSQEGPVNLRVTMTAVSTGTQWRVKSVRVHGEDVSDTGLSVKAGDNIDDIEIEMTTRSQTIAGTVVDGQGAPVRNALVFFFSQDRDRWSSATGRYTSSTRTDDKGQFKASSALPPGDYYAFVAPDPGPLGIDANDPEFLDSASRSAVRMSLMEGSTTTLNLSFSR